MPNMVPARYIGGHEILLSKYGGPYYDAEGQRIASMNRSYGETLMMPEEEIRGSTWLIDPRAQADPINLGLGRVVRDQDDGLSDEELYNKGYRFSLGRPDFEYIEAVPAEETKPEVKSRTKKEE